ncbi:hypothetical protein WN55_08269 [Dufourea novaeangliae]|uniref:Uncharacterized protein n=1 Tax=Dufourea novaeangliae TaxID=178035 RepID=A0A154P8F8_DUFNO|nr:hypothetical protein WN55_08269 [Dufourea novaeangliae]
MGESKGYDRQREREWVRVKETDGDGKAVVESRNEGVKAAVTSSPALFHVASWKM